MHNSAPARLTSSAGQNFMVYPGGEGTVFLERVRPSGRRDGNSIFQFDISILSAAIAAVTAPTPLAAVSSLVA